MGWCPSRCGGKRAAQGIELTAAASNRAKELNTKAAAASPYDPNRSLKRFLHLNQETTKSSTSTSTRSSFVESVAVPPSSELFSLPGSELQRRSSFGLSPITPLTHRASISSHFKHHISFTSSRRGYSNKRIQGVTGGVQVDPAARQRLIDAIARLERLNDAAKSSVLGLRQSSTCDSAMPVAKSNQPSTRNRHVRHFQLPVRQSSMDKSFSHLPTTKLVSFDTTPTVKDVLRTVEKFVSLMDAPRHRTTASNTVPKRHKNEDTDSEETFTLEFGASKTISGVHNQLKQSPARTKAVSLQRLVQSATQPLHGQKSPVLEVVMPVIESASSRDWKSSSSTWPPVEMLVKQSETAAKARVSADADMKPFREDESDAAKPTPDRNVVTTKKTKSPRSTSGVRASKGFRQGRLSRSLDSIESSDLLVDLGSNRTSAMPIATSRLTNLALPRKLLTEVDVKSTEVKLLPVLSSWSCKRELSGCEHKLELEENCGDRVLDDLTTAELDSPQILPSQEVASLVENGNRKSIENSDCSCCERECPGESHQRFGLVEAFHGLLKLLVVSTSKHAGAVTLDPDEENQYGVLPWG